MSCKLKHRYSKQNAKNRLIQAGAINEFNQILDEKTFITQMNLINNYGKSEYNIDAKFVQRDDVTTNKVIFNTAAFKAVDILKGALPDTYADNNTQHYLDKARGQVFYQPAFDSFFSAGSNNTNGTPNLSQIISLKQSLLSRAKQRLSEIKPQLKENKDNLPKYQELLKLQTELTDYIEGNETKGIKGLEQEIEDLSQIDSRAPEIIAPYIEKELDRLDQLVKSGDPNQTKEAHTIIDFVKNLANFNPIDITRMPGGQHPLYNKTELYNSNGDFLLTDAMIQPFKEWAKIAEEQENKLAVQSRIIIESVYNTNQKIEQLFGDKKFTYEEIVNSTQGLKDTNWIDMMLMDISSGIFSHNGLMPQVIKNIVETQFEKEQAWAKDIQEKIDNLVPQVREELKKLGYGLDAVGILGKDGVVYDLFKQMSNENQSTGNIAHKFSHQWFEDLSDMQHHFSLALKNASKIPDDSLKRQAFKVALDNRNKWFKKNTKLINPALIGELVNNPEFASLSTHFTYSNNEIATHEAEIKAVIGEQYFKNIIASQSAKLREYITQRELTLTNILAGEGVMSFNELTDVAKRGFEIWEAEHNPFKAVEYRENGAFRVGINDYHSKMEFNEYVPIGDKYYDKNYAKIESNPTLKEFYDVVFDATSMMKHKLPYEMQKKMLATSVPYLEKSIMEIMIDKDLTFWQAISKIFRKIWDDIAGLIGINKQEQFSFSQVNPNTGLPDYKVNDSFMSQNVDKINDLFLIKRVKFAQAINVSRITKFTNVNVNKMAPVILAELNKVAGTSYTLTSLKSEFGDSIPLGRILYRAAQHEIAQDKSFDLPKVIKLYSHLTAQYAARQQMLPLVELLKDHYQQIQKQVTQNTDDAIINARTDTKTNRLSGLRTNANKQFDDWFERVVLGNYGLKKNYGVTGKKVYTEDEKIQLEELEKLMSTLAPDFMTNGTLPTDEQDKKEFLRLKNIYDNLGKDVAASAVIDSFMKFIRFKGLGFNLSSGLTNFIEGQVSNSITASTGMYFNPEHIYEVSPSDMIFGNLVKQTNPGLQPEKVAKADFLSKATDILQDNTNELQRASNKSAFAGLRRLNPFYITAKTEQYNQIPLMVATLKGTTITGINGETSNVWDALQGVYNQDSKQWTVVLKPEFATENNKKSWEDYTGTEYLNWKAKIKQVIINTHGDFSETGGMMAKSSHIGQMFLMFKTWLPRELYKRFATEQTDLAAGIQGFKGRWKSHTPVTAAMQGGIMGSFFMGPVGGLIGASAGFGLAQFYGVRTGLTLIEELVLTNKLLARKLMGIPVNLAASLVGQKNVINTHLSDRESNKFLFSRQDFNNFRGNMQEMSMMLTWFGLLLLTKAVLWDDDDEEDDTRRQWHNLLANRFMQLSSQAMLYVNFAELNKNLDLPIIKFFTQVTETVADASKAINGEDTLLTGVNAGESRLWNQTKSTFLPGLLANPTNIGFGKQMERQFQPSQYDSYFFGEEKLAKKEIQKLKVERRKELESTGMSEEEVEDTLKEEFPRRGKDQTYVEKLEEIETEE